MAAEVTWAVENIGARRLQTVMENCWRISFDAEDRRGETLLVDADFVEKQLVELRGTHLSRYVCRPRTTGRLISTARRHASRRGQFLLSGYP